jgi:hypothetical protein
MTSRARIRRLHLNRGPVSVRAQNGSTSIHHLAARKSQYFQDLEGEGLTEKDVLAQPWSDYLLNGPAHVGDSLL